jgi:hypothetical protein
VTRNSSAVPRDRLALRTSRGLSPHRTARGTKDLTLAKTKRQGLEQLYRYDDRVAPWTGTAHGVLQAVNTYEHHEGTVRGGSRPERNMTRTINGDFSKLDRSSWATLERVFV